MFRIARSDLAEASDDVLLAAFAQSGDRSEAAAGILFDRHHRGLLGFFCRRGASQHDAEELLQETFIKLVRSIRGGAKPDSIGYLWRCAETVLLDRIKHDHAQSRSTEAVVSIDADQVADVPGKRDVDDQSLQRCIEQTIAVYSQRWPERSELIRLIVYEQWTPREIAGFMNRTLAAARQLVYDCRKQLRAMVERRCLTTDGSAGND